MKQKAYVTGADRGLGLALTRLLLEEGYKVYAGSFMPEWEQLTELKQSHTDDLVVLPLDVTDDGSVAKAAETIQEDTNSLDILINNAAIFKDRSGDIFGPLYFDDMMKLYETNTLGPLRVTHSVIRLLVNGERKILANISSESGSISNNWRTKEYGYSMTKTALNMQSVMLQKNLKDYGVKIFAFHPGWLRSFMLGKLNEEATVEPVDSARGIYKQLMTQTDLDGPIYMDYQGNIMTW